MRSYKVFLNLISNLVMQLCAIIAGIIIPQMILKQYGSRINGFTSSINQFLGYFSLVEGGIGAASIVALYKPFADKDEKKIREIYHSTSSYLNKAGIFYMIFLMVLAIGYPVVIHSGLNTFLVRSLIVVIGFGKMIELIVLGRYRIILTADQNIGIYAFAQTIGYICTVQFAFLSVQFGLGIVEMQICIFMTYVLRTYILCKICKNKYRHIINIHKGQKISKIVIPQQSAALVHQIASMVAYNTDMIVLTFVVSLLEVSIYSVYSVLFNGIQSILTAFQNVITPAFGDMLSRNEEENLENAFSSYEFLYYFMTTTVTIGVILLIEPFIMLYSNGISDCKYWDAKIAAFFIVIFILNNFRLPGSILISAAGHLKQTQYFFILEAVLNLVISVILVKPLGITGCLIGTFFSGGVRLFFVLLYPYFKIHKFSLKIMLKRGVYNVVMIVAAWLGRTMLDGRVSNWFQFFCYGITIVIIVVTFQVIVAFFMDKREFKILVEKIRLILKRGRVL